MKFPRTQLAAVLAERSLKNGNSHEFSREIAAYLLDEGRTNELESLLRDIIAFRADKGVVEVRVASAHDLSEAVRADLTKQVKTLYPDATQVIISPLHDDGLIGGVRLDFPNQQLDLSVRAKLRRFKQLTTAGRN